MPQLAATRTLFAIGLARLPDRFGRMSRSQGSEIHTSGSDPRSSFCWCAHKALPRRAAQATSPKEAASCSPLSQKPTNVMQCILGNVLWYRGLCGTLDSWYTVHHSFLNLSLSFFFQTILITTFSFPPSRGFSFDDAVQDGLQHAWRLRWRLWCYGCRSWCHRCSRHERKTQHLPYVFMSLTFMLPLANSTSAN